MPHTSRDLFPAAKQCDRSYSPSDMHVYIHRIDSPGEILRKSSHTVFGDTSTLPTVLVTMAKDTIRGALVDYFTQQCVYESMSTETPAALGTSTLLDLDKLQVSLGRKVIHRRIQKQSFRRSLGLFTISTTIIRRLPVAEGMKDGLR